MKYEINFYNMNQIIVLVYIEYVLGIYGGFACSNISVNLSD